MPEKPLILASASPRRRELLEEQRIAFDVVTTDVRELNAASAPGLSPIDLARENARRKAVAVAQSGKAVRRWVLGADTVVALDRRIFGKPASLDEAREFLLALSGRTHEVITGCALIDPSGHDEIFHDISRVTFLPLAHDIIESYLDDVDVLDKAGAYALQQHADRIIARVEGSHSNVIGLPMEAVGKVLLRHRLL